MFGAMQLADIVAFPTKLQKNKLIEGDGGGEGAKSTFVHIWLEAEPVSGSQILNGFLGAFTRNHRRSY